MLRSSSSSSSTRFSSATSTSRLRTSASAWAAELRASSVALRRLVDSCSVPLSTLSSPQISWASCFVNSEFPQVASTPRSSASPSSRRPKRLAAVAATSSQRRLASSAADAARAFTCCPSAAFACTAESSARSGSSSLRRVVWSSATAASSCDRSRRRVSASSARGCASKEARSAPAICSRCWSSAAWNSWRAASSSWRSLCSVATTALETSSMPAAKSPVLCMMSMCRARTSSLECDRLFASSRSVSTSPRRLWRSVSVCPCCNCSTSLMAAFSSRMPRIAACAAAESALCCSHSFRKMSYFAYFCSWSASISARSFAVSASTPDSPSTRRCWRVSSAMTACWACSWRFTSTISALCSCAVLFRSSAARWISTTPATLMFCTELSTSISTWRVRRADSTAASCAVTPNGVLASPPAGAMSLVVVRGPTVLLSVGRGEGPLLEDPCGGIVLSSGSISRSSTVGRFFHDRRPASLTRDWALAGGTIVPGGLV
mmetsp:Transcript_94936/g.245160  ORF Transcript_94936/g.245160 Transcript_94936/m.245160 type:complete len:491 (-) Transcript_94936:535-2007(-)